jgi:hypothetical protein
MVLASVQTLMAGWRRWKAAAAREFLRDPDVTLFERRSETAPVPTSPRGA